MLTAKRKASDTYFDGSVYCGDYVNATRHGYGVMAWPNRTRYAVREFQVEMTYN